MNQFIIKQQNYILIFAIIGMMISCKNNNINKENNSNSEITTEAETHDEEIQTIATLTEEQINTVGIKLGKVENKELTATIKANGLLRVPNNSKANVTSLYGGVIKTLNIQIGDYVKKGQVIATITNPQFIQLQEEYLTIENKITFAEQEAQRQQTLNTGNAGILKNLQATTAELNTLRTRSASLQKQLQLMGINPSSISISKLNTSIVITSPLSGSISNIFSKIGSYVDVSSPVAEIVDNSSLHLDLQVFEKDLPLIKVGQTIYFTLTNNPTNQYEAKVFSIGSSFENDSKTIAVHASVLGNKAGLIDGMNITGMVSFSHSNTQAVPDEAIVNADGKYYLFIVTDKAPKKHTDEENGHDHKTDKKAKTDNKQKSETLNFEKIEIVKGISNMGFTAVSFTKDIAKNAQIVTKGAFFINAKLSNTGDHEH